MPVAIITPLDLTDAGFRAEQFGTPADWAANDGYLHRLIDRAEQWARGQLGAAYDTIQALPGTPQHERLRAAELCWASAELWNRRARFIDSNAVSSLERLVYLDRREFEAQSDRAMECARNAIAAIKGEGAWGTAAAVSIIETGPYGRGVGGARCG